MMASVKPVDGIMEELNQPSALFLGNPALLSELMEWIDDGRMSRLVLKREDDKEAPHQAEV